MDSLQTLREAHTAAIRLGNSTHPDPDKAVVDVARAWPHLVVAAAEAGAAFNASDPARTLDRIALSARAAHATGTPWPRRGPLDENRGRLLEHLHQVARQDTSHLLLEQRREATRLLTSIIWLTAEHSTRVISRYVGGHDHVHVRRVGEQIAAGGHLAATSLHSPAQADRARSAAAALAAWDLEAHRALLATRSTLTLHAVAQLEADITRRLQGAMRHAGTQVDDIDPSDLKPVLRALDMITKNWREVALETRDLAIAWEPLPVNLIKSGLELRDQLRDETVSSAPREQQRELLAVHHSHLASLISLADTARDLSREGVLRAPTKVIERVLRERDSTRPVLTMPKTLPLPPELRAGITAVLHTAHLTSSAALHGSAAVDKVYRSPTPAVAPVASSMAGLPPLPSIEAAPAGPPL